jgi:hypothetical protein
MIIPGQLKKTTRDALQKSIKEVLVHRS